MTNKQRLLGKVIVLFSISFVLAGCGSLPTKVNNPSYTDNSQEIKSENRYPIIEIWQELDGSVQIKGKSLYFRIYDDGVVEFEYELRKKNESGKPRYKYSIEKTPPTKISEEEFNRFKSVLEDLVKSKSVKQEYESVGLTLDTGAKLTILLKESDTAKKRKIIVNNSDSYIMDESLKKNFPKQLVTLIEEIHLIRGKLQKE